ncbi:hypothetical protein HIM_05854 [Hirsutella minnesotensis 3608]|uniref:Uncharacterized protein n=1 Tax=Hirsutella minnesotensis 3608 TaxID=1043627 RepID=A0A0F7ZZS6_9HYPO|nr:hypothetical protein HIM_05854 [Hirsutella minnesotensis 3608]
MSWARDDDYEAYKQAAHHCPSHTSSDGWRLNVWHVTDGMSHPHRRQVLKASLILDQEEPHGAWHVNVDTQHLHGKAKLRIVFAPLHEPHRGSLPDVLELFRALGVPSDFSTEILQSVCHSFGRRTDGHGSCSWFHFLFKNISVRHEPGKLPEIENRAAKPKFPPSTLPQADYSWLKSSFFLRQHQDGSSTLVCFGALPRVRHRLGLFIDSGNWHDVGLNPHVLFDVVLEGLYSEVDETVWNMNVVFGPLEHSILEMAHTRDPKLSSKISFAALHNCAKHITYLAEGLQSCIMTADALLVNSEGSTSRRDDAESAAAASLVLLQLRECIRYRRSLFRSTQLRLSSLQKRIDNTIMLAFNVVTQKDSMVVTRDSSIMKMIAAITMVFLPTTGVATVAGSQLFTSNWHEDTRSWSVMASPLFWLTWWISIPLTVGVVMLALFWQWWMHAERPHLGDISRLRRPVELVEGRSEK